MKKLFTLAAAVLASFSLWAGAVTLSDVTPESNWYAEEGVGRVTNKSGNAFANSEMTCDGSTGYKTGSSYFTVQTFQDISSLTVWARSGSNRTISCVYVSEDLQTSAKSESNVEYELIGGSESYAIVSNSCDNTFTLNFSNTVSTNSYIQIKLNGNAEIVAVTFGEDTPATDPVANVTIAGAEEGYTGAAIKYTAATDVKANAYKWYVNGLEQAGQNAKTFTFTPAAEGTYSISAAAKNDNNADFVASNSISLVVTAAPITDTYIWRAGSGYAGCVEAPDAKANANQASTDLEHSTATFEGVGSMTRPSVAGTEVVLTFLAKEGYGIASVCAYGKLEEAAGAQYSWDGTNWETLEAYSESAVTFDAPEGVAAPSFTIKYTSADPEKGGLWWRNALLTFVERPAAVISYDANGGAGEMESTTGTVAENAFTAPEGKEFDVWNTAADGSGVTYYAKDYINSDVTLYAIWRPEGAQNTDATLSALSVAGYTLSPTFDADTHEYTITKPYGAANPELSAVTAETHDRKATGAVISNIENGFSIVVTAEDLSVYLTYTISILEAEAKKDLLEATFSNGVHGYINAGKITVPYLAGEGLPTFVEAHCWNADSLPVPPIAGMVEDKLVVTGADGKPAEYSIEYVALAPAALDKDSTYTFDTTAVVQPSYIYSVYGWDADKGVKFSKDVEESNNKRISLGKDRICMALPAAKYVYLTSGSANSRPVKILINGVLSEVAKTAKQNEDIMLPLDETKPNFLVIESDGNNGDAGFTRIRLTDQAITYTVNLAQTENGTIRFGLVGATGRFEPGIIVPLVVTPAEGYKVEAVKYNDGEDHAIEAVEGVYSFTMPAANVTVSATFVEDGEPIEPQPSDAFAITVNAGEHGSANADYATAEAGDLITLTITADEGYQVKEVLVNGVGLMPENGVYSFTMPAQAVVVSVTFEPIPQEGLNDIDAAAKAVKRLENGMLVIEKNGKVYNIIGSVIR